MDCISKAALYIRVSTEEQAAEGQSVDGQIETLSQYCKLYNIEIYDIYKDLGISGKETQNRPGLIKLLHDARQLRFDMVLVWKISRLSRSLKDLLLIIDELDQLNIVFSSYSEKFDTSTPVGKMTLQLLGSIAEFERNTIIDNVKLGLHEFASKGGKTGTVLGYDNHEKQLIVNPSEAEIVKLIYRLYTQSQMSLHEIASHLNELGYRTKRGNCFNKDGISVILSNPVYIGVNRHKVGHKEEYHIPAFHPHIIDVDTWNKVQNLRENNRKRRIKRECKHNFLLSGKIICPHCSSSMYSFTSTVGNKNYRYYRCKGCSRTCKADVIEEEVLKELKEQLNNEKIINDAALQANIPDNSNKNIFSEQLQKECSKIKKLMDKYVLLLERDEFTTSEVIISKIKELEIKLKVLQDNYEAASVNDNKAIASLSNEDYLNNINEILNNQDKAGIKRIIDTAIKSIHLYPNKKIKEIIFNLNNH